MANVAASTVGGYGSAFINPDGSQNVDPTSDAPSTIAQVPGPNGSAGTGVLVAGVTNAVLNIILVELRVIAEVLNQQGPQWDLSQLRAEFLSQMSTAPGASQPVATSATGSFGGVAGSI